MFLSSFHFIMFIVPLLIIALAVGLSYRIKFRDNG